MPARNTFFSFDKGIKLNKDNMCALRDMLFDLLDEEELAALKEAYSTEQFDKNFFTFLFKELKSFDSVSEDGDYCYEKTRAVLPLVLRTVGRSEGNALGLKRLYDEWDYEGTGQEEHVYFTFADETSTAKKLVKEAEAAVKKLHAIGVDATLTIVHKVPTGEAEDYLKMYKLADKLSSELVAASQNEK